MTVKWQQIQSGSRRAGQDGFFFFLFPLEQFQIQHKDSVKHWHQKQSNERSHTQAADLGVAERTTMERNAGLLLYVFAFERKTRDQK